MARAYAYADGDGPEPRELDAVRAIRAFGAEAVWGRPLGVGEIKCMVLADNIVQAYRARAAHADGWAAWASAFPAENHILNLAMRLANAE